MTEEGFDWHVRSVGALPITQGARDRLIRSCIALAHRPFILQAIAIRLCEGRESLEGIVDDLLQVIDTPMPNNDPLTLQIYSIVTEIFDRVIKRPLAEETASYLLLKAFERMFCHNAFSTAFKMDVRHLHRELSSRMRAQFLARPQPFAFPLCKPHVKNTFRWAGLQAQQTAWERYAKVQAPLLKAADQASVWDDGVNTVLVEDTSLLKNSESEAQESSIKPGYDAEHMDWADVDIGEFPNLGLPTNVFDYSSQHFKNTIWASSNPLLLNLDVPVCSEVEPLNGKNPASLAEVCLNSFTEELAMSVFKFVFSD